MDVDAVKQAEELQQTFFNLSNAVADFRLRNFNALTPEKRDQLREQSDALDTRGQQFTADALAAIQAQIQPHLESIQQATKSACDALARLNDVAKALAVVDAAVTLVGSIATGDIAKVGGDVEGLVKAIGS